MAYHSRHGLIAKFSCESASMRHWVQCADLTPTLWRAVMGSEGEEAEQMMDLEPLPPLTAAKPASPGAAASSPRYFTGAAAHEVRPTPGHRRLTVCLVLSCGPDVGAHYGLLTAQLN